MLKHVQLSPYRARALDSMSDTSSSSSGSSTSSSSSQDSTTLISRIRHQDSTRLRRECLIQQDVNNHSLSQEPLSSLLSSRSSSYCSLSEASLSQRSPTTTIKVYAKCLRPDIEYKTLGITYQTTCRELVNMLLNKYKMRHRDPNLFYLTMEVTVRKAGLRTVLALDDEARPAALQSCHPKGDSKFALQTRRGGLVKIYDSLLMPGSQYKSLLISDRTTVDELIQILLNCYNLSERVEQYSLYEVCEDQEYQRKLHPDDCPLQVQNTWLRDLNFHFLVRRNTTDFRQRLRNPWSPQSTSTPCSSRQHLDQQRTSTSSLCSSSSSEDGLPTRTSSYSEYDNYFYI